MKKNKRKWDRLTEAKRNSCIDEVINYFEKERDEKIGVLVAGDILDFFQQSIGGAIYNKGVEDSKILLRNHFEDLEVDLDSLNA